MQQSMNATVVKTRYQHESRRGNTVDDMLPQTVIIVMTLLSLLTGLKL